MRLRYSQYFLGFVYSKDTGGFRFFWTHTNVYEHYMEPVRKSKYQIEAGVWPSKKPGQGRSGSLGPRSIFRASGFGWRWQDSEYVRLGEDSKMAVMFGEACMYLVHTP